MLAAKIKEAMQKQNISIYKLAKLSGMSQTGLTYFLTGSKSPTIATLEKICNALGIEIGSLFTGTESNIEEQRLLTRFRKANAQARDSAMYVLYRGTSESAVNNKRADRLPVLSVLSIPVVGKAAAGKPIEMIEQNDESISIDGVRNGDFAVIADGNSMIDVGINNGDYVIIRPQSMVENGEIALVAVNDGSTIKRFYLDDDGIRLEPENADEHTQSYSFDDGVRVLGKLVRVVKDKDI